MKPMKLGTETGSLFNHLMSNNSVQPEVGKGGTMLHYSDRDAFEVLSVSEDKQSCTIQMYKHERIDDNGMSDCQTYKYETLEGPIKTLVFNRGSWKEKFQVVDFEKSFYKQFESESAGLCGSQYNKVREKYFSDIFTDEPRGMKIVPGKTKLVTRYSKVNVLFGSKQTYYDFSF